MLLPLKAICDGKKIRRDGTSLVHIQYCYSSDHRTLLNTEIAIPPEYWNKKKLCILNGLPATYDSSDNLNKELIRIIRNIEDIVEVANKRQVEDKGSFVKEVFSPKATFTSIETIEQIPIPSIAKKTAGDIYSQIDNYIISKEKKVTKATVNIFKTMKGHLSAFKKYSKKPVTFQSFDYNFLRRFHSFFDI